MNDDLDRLADLQHDLGKHLLLPLAMLPGDADAGALQAALRRALLATRRGPAGEVPARQIWAAFRAEAGDDVLARPEGRRLTEVVARALAWEERLAAPIDRVAAHADLAAVSPAIRALIATLQAGRP